MIIYRPDFSFVASLRASLDVWGSGGGYGTRPDLSDVEPLGGGMVRIWNQPEYRAERFISWWSVASVRGFGSAREVSLEYDLAIGTDMTMTAAGAKLPGLTGRYFGGPQGFPWETYDLSPCSMWENRLWHGPLTSKGYALGNYLYCVRNPSRPDGTPGLPASPARYDGSGNPEHSRLMTTGYLEPGRTHRIRQTIRLNTVLDPAFRPQSIDDALGNGNPDGLLRIELDGQTVGEWDTVTFRGEEGVRFFSAWLNIYQGGTGRYVTSRCHYDLGRVSISADEQPQQQPEGDPMATVTVIVPEGTEVQVLNAIPPDPALAALQARFDTYVAAVRAKAQAAKDADAARIEGQDVLDIVP